MPIYDYECLECEKTFEAIRKVGERKDELNCPVCGSKKLRQRVTSFRMHGWSSFIDEMGQKISSPHLGK